MNTFVDEGNPSEEQLMLLENITAAVISERLPLPTAVQTAAQLRQQFLTQAQVMNDIAIERLEHAEEICGGFVLELRHAKKWLESTLQPWTRNAAQAELLCANVLQWVQNNDVQLNIRRSEKPVKEACKRVRDVFVTRIRANMADQKDRPGFIVQLKEAYDSCIKPVTLKEVTEDQWKEERKDNWARQRALLLLAYDKLDREAGQTGFVSNNRVANDRRGGVARPRRRRQSAGGLRVSGNENSEEQVIHSPCLRESANENSQAQVIYTKVEYYDDSQGEWLEHDDSEETFLASGCPMKVGDGDWEMVEDDTVWELLTQEWGIEPAKVLEQDADWEMVMQKPGGEDADSVFEMVYGAEPARIELTKGPQALQAGRDEALPPAGRREASHFPGREPTSPVVGFQSNNFQ